MDVSDLMKLMESKKRCLRRYLDLSERFIASAEEGDLTGLDAFDAEREAIIKALGMFDRKVTQVATAIPQAERGAKLASEVQLSLDAEAMLIQQILRADDRIMACIEKEKGRLQREIAAGQRSKEIAGRFKSGWITESGEGLDSKA